MARPERFQFPDDSGIRFRRHGAVADRRQPPARRRYYCARGRGPDGDHARSHHQRLRDPAGRHGAEAARFAGFSSNQLVIVTFLISGALAGLAGIIEVAGPVGHLQPGISPGYGFTAIIVAFLGRLNPIGILVAGLFLALTFIGGEQAQISMKIPLDLTKVCQGMLLFYVLACDSLILYRISLVRTRKAAAHGTA